jgi:phosphoglycerol transferase MdoB-like AlkP superfamily enzyme
VTNAGLESLLLFLVVIVLSAAGIALSGGSSASGVTSARWGIAAYLAALAVALASIWPETAATWTLLAYVAAACVLLPRPLGWLALSGIAGLHVLLTWISRVKAGLTGLPVTVLDIRIALANPAGLWDALSLPHWTRYVATAVIVLGCFGVLVAALLAGRRFLRRGGRLGPGDALRVAALGVIGLMIHLHLQVVYADAARDNSTWEPRNVAGLADRIGVLPFLAYSYRLESQSTGDLYGRDRDAVPPNAAELRNAVLDVVDFGKDADPAARLLPNIVVVLAESTFDPGAVFRLEGEWNDELFRAGESTAATGLLRVNAVGGGTWITEFETIVGLDTRLFGYAGMYSHASLSPFVDRSIATYLRDRGYHTWAFFPHGGEFYNARNAYANYGFENILDSRDLGKGDWLANDVGMASSVAETLGAEPQQPFFAYVLFLENHAPHDCGMDEGAAFPVRFADTGDFEPNCALHDYLRRLGSTTAAVRSLVGYLGAIEARTGRPFVLLVFGDHQPHTFASTGGFHYDYGPLRKLEDTRMTFFHFISSVPGRRLRCCATAPSAADLPSLLSGFVATSPDDVYLATNLWLHARCGSEAVQLDFGNFMEPLNSRDVDRRTAECREAYVRALASYRRAGVVRLGGDAPD